MRVWTALAVLALAAPSSGEAGTASGNFTVKGKAWKLSHAYARDKAGTKEIEVTLTDVPLDAKALEDPTPIALMDLSRAGKLHGVRFWINPATKAVTGTSLFDYASFKMGSVSAAGTDLKVDLKTLDKATVAGRLYTAKPQDFNEVPYEYSVTFSTAITK